jgi:Tfp pilus assembly protein FimT
MTNRRMIAIWLVLLAAVTQAAAPVAAQTGDEPALEQQANQLYEAGQYAGALAVARQWVQREERDESEKGRPGSATAQALGAASI